MNINNEIFEIVSNIVVFNIKTRTFVDMFIIVINTVCKFIENVISISNIKNLNYITLLSSYYYFFNYVFLI